MLECSLSECDRPHYGRGYCRNHWRAYRQYGDPRAVKRLRGAPIEERIRQFTRQEGECIVWVGSRDAKGYGRIHVAGGGRVASRVAYEAAHGPIPAGLVVRHKCDNPPCVNLDHLEVGTSADNARDMVVRGRSAKGEANSRARLTREQVRLARQRIAAGESRRSVALSLGVRPQTMDAIAAGHTWKEADDE